MGLSKKNVLLGILAFVVIAIIGVSFTLINKGKQATIKENDTVKVSESTKKKSSDSTNSVINPVTGKSEEGKSADSTIKTEEKATSSDNELEYWNKTEAFFTALFTYNQTNFLSRFDGLGKYATPSVVDQMKGTNPEEPKVTIESKISDYKFYRNQRAEGIEGIATMEVRLMYQGQIQLSKFVYTVKYDPEMQKITEAVPLPLEQAEDLG